MNQRFEVNGLDSHCSTLFLLFCFQNKIISSGQTHVLSAFTAVLQFIADTNFSTTTLELQNGSTTTSVKSSTSSTTHRTALNLLLSLSNSATFNVSWRMSSTQLESLKAAAKSSLAQIQLAEDSAFTHVFMTKRNFFLNYNLYLHIQLTPSSPFFLTRYRAYKLLLWALFFVFFPSFVSLFLSNPFSPTVYCREEYNNSKDTSSALFKHNYEISLDACDVTLSSYLAQRAEVLLSLALGNRLLDGSIQSMVRHSFDTETRRYLFHYKLSF